MLDSLVRVSRRVDNPLHQKPRSSPLLVAGTSPPERSIISLDLKVRRLIRPGGHPPGPRTPVIRLYSNSSALKAFTTASPAIRSGWPSCVPITSRLHKPQLQLLSHELSVHIILFQALLTLFSKFFSVFLHSTSSLSVFL